MMWADSAWPWWLLGLIQGLVAGVLFGRRAMRRRDLVGALERMSGQEVAELVAALEARWGVAAVRVAEMSASERDEGEP